MSALSLILGWEAMVVLRDVRGLDATREAEVMRSASTALVEAALQEISD